MQLYGIFGAGGFGREVMPLARQMLEARFPASTWKLVYIDDSRASADKCQPREIVTPAEFFALQAESRHFNIAIANHSTRQRLAEKLLKAGAIPFRITASSAITLDNNQIAEGAILCPFTTITSNARIGKFFHANIYSYVAHDCIIGDYVTFAPGVHCNGNVIVEDQVYAGTGVIIREGTPDHPLVIGKGAVLGMGAVVTKSIPPGITVIGNPAKPMPVKTPA